MPYCTQCGQPTLDVDVYCGSCGRRQPGADKKASTVGAGLTPRTASMLCYVPVVGWIPAIVVLASQKFRHERTVRFHAFQGIYLFVAWLLVDWVIGPIYGFSMGDFHGHWFGGHLITGLLKAAIFFTWIFMLIKTSHEELYRLPIIGELAERSVSEQR